MSRIVCCLRQIVCASLSILVLSGLYAGRLEARPARYLIIYHSSLAGPALNDLLSLESGRGFDVLAFPISDGVSRDSVKSIISNIDKQPFLRYVLLVGSFRSSADTVGCPDCYANTAAGNLVPTFMIRTQLFGDTTQYHRVSYDYRYAGDSYLLSWPDLIVGRIPAVDTVDLRSYVTKLQHYLADTAGSSWKNDVLALVGDQDRGGIQTGHPDAGTINSELNWIMQSIPMTFDKSFVRFSDFSSWLGRRQAVVSGLDSGKILVFSEATGANRLNFSDLLDRRSFCAYRDLTPTYRYSIIVGASCSLGESDLVEPSSDSTLRLWPENFLFAPNRGAIVYIGPSSLTDQWSNFSFLRRFSRLITTCPDLSVGEVFNAVQHRDTLTWMGVDNVLMLYTLYGDPSLTVNCPGLPTGRLTAFDFEYGKRQPFEDSVFEPNGQVTADTAFVSTTGGTYGTERVYRVIGNDNYAAAGSSYKSWLVYDNLGIPISDSTRFMVYTIDPEAHPEDTGRYGVNAMLRSGARLSDPVGSAYITDQRGDRLDAVHRKNRIFHATDYACDLVARIGDTLDKIVVEYDAARPESQGRFAFTIYDVSFVRHWGYAPVVGEINSVGQLPTNTTTMVQIDAADDDAPKGDSLTYTWTATAGTITGTGRSVTYRAPSTTMQVQVSVTVSDKGAHSVTRDKTIVVIDGPPGGCPMLYVYSGGQYKLDNVILTGSEDRERSSEITEDYYPLQFKPDLLGGKVRLRVAEEEKEESSVYGVSVIAYDVSSLQGEERLAITASGDIVAISKPIKPLFAVTEEGFDVVQRIASNDGIFFESNKPGYLDVGFDLGSFGARNGAGKSLGGEDGGGGAAGPPGKYPNIEKVVAEERTTNLLRVGVYDSDEHLTAVGTVSPRKNASLPVLVEFTDYITADNHGWFVCRLSWDRDYRIDQFAFYSFRHVPNIGALSLAQAKDDSRNDLTDLLQSNSGKAYQLLPGRRMDLEFGAGTTKSLQSIQLVLKTAGFYKSSETNSGGADEGKSLTVSQNFPNPFNISTQFSVSVKKETTLRVDVFNVLGQRVKTLFDASVLPGTVLLSWGGSDESNQPVASGIYYYRIKTGELSETKKMVLLK